MPSPPRTVSPVAGLPGIDPSIPPVGLCLTRGYRREGGMSESRAISVRWSSNHTPLSMWYVKNMYQLDDLEGREM